MMDIQKSITTACLHVKHKDFQKKIFPGSTIKYAGWKPYLESLKI